MCFLALSTHATENRSLKIVSIELSCTWHEVNKKRNEDEKFHAGMSMQEAVCFCVRLYLVLTRLRQIQPTSLVGDTTGLKIFSLCRERMD